MIKHGYPIQSMLCVAVLSLGLVCSATSRADENDNQQGGEIDGTESADLEMKMTPTSAAPAGSSIELSLENDDEDGTTTAQLKLETDGLPAGTYNVTATLKSNGSSVAIGSFTTDGRSEFEVEFGTEGGASFPAGLNPFDIATLSVTDANGVVLFTADLTSITSVSSAVFAASVNAVAGNLAPTAAGHVTINAHALHGIATGSLTVTGTGLPPGAKLSLAVNDTNIKKATVDKTGGLNVVATTKGKSGTLGHGISVFGAKSVKVRDAAGNVALGADL